MRQSRTVLHAHAQSGSTLAEVLALSAILGFLVVMLAPVEKFLLGTLRETGPERTAALDLARSASLLCADARRAERLRIETPARLCLSMPGGGEVVWEETSNGVQRTYTSSRSERPTKQRFPGVEGFRPTVLRSNLLGAMLVARAGESRQVSACLRNTGQQP